MRKIFPQTNQYIAQILPYCLFGYWLIIASQIVIAKAIPDIDHQIYTTSAQQKIHVLDIDPKKVNITTVIAKDFRNPLETVANIAKHYNAIAAINGGFFSINDQNNAISAGLLLLRDQLHGIAYQPRGAIGWNLNKQLVLIDRVQTKTSLHLNDSTLPINAMNQPLKPRRLILYSDSYGTIANTNVENIHIIIQDGKIADIQSQDVIKIPAKGYVYSIGKYAKQLLPTVNIGDQIAIDLQLLPQLAPSDEHLWSQATFIVGGAPLLIKQGKQITDYKKENVNHKFIAERLARTAIGILKNGHWLLAVVEKNSLLNQQGMSIPELASFMQQLGCIEALNLDGGSSSTMYFDNKVITGADDDNLSITATRQVANAILILPKE